LNELDANIFFVMPPDMKTLEVRMREQGFSEEDELRKRLRSSQAEIEFAKDHREIFKELIANNDGFDGSY
jgi:guanylate kinase